MADSVLLYAGLFAAGIGFLSLLRPLRFLRIRTRRAGAGILLAGIGLASAVAVWPASRHRATGPAEALDEFLPEYHFHEVHQLMVHASTQRVFQAIHDVRPDEIRWLGTLMAVRRLPEELLSGGRPPDVIPGYRLQSMERRQTMTRKFRNGPGVTEEAMVTGASLEAEYRKEEKTPVWAPERILGAYRDALERIGGREVSREEDRGATFHLERGSLNLWVEITANPTGGSFHLSSVRSESPSGEQTMIQEMLGSGFLLLREIRDHEIVFGLVHWMASGGSGVPPGRPEDFASFMEPGAVKIAANFRVEDSEGGWSKVTTETRILATDRKSKTRFGIYWRLIHPGSAIIRRSWLEAIRRRAEGRAPASARSYAPSQTWPPARIACGEPCAGG